MQVFTKRSWRQKISQEKPINPTFGNRFSVLEEGDEENDGNQDITMEVSSQQTLSIPENAVTIVGLHGDDTLHGQQSAMVDNVNVEVTGLRRDDSLRGQQHTKSTESGCALEPHVTRTLVTEEEIRPSSPVTVVEEGSVVLAGIDSSKLFPIPPDEQLQKASIITARENIYMPHIVNVEDTHSKRKTGANTRAVAVDGRVSESGIPVVSKCNCCAAPQCEDLNHVFIGSDIATHMWRWFLPLVPNNIHLHSQLTTRIRNFIHNTNVQTPLGFISIYCLILMLWELWKSRCAARFDHQRRRPAEIIRSIKLHVGLVLGKMMFKTDQSLVTHQLLQSYGFTYHTMAKRMKLVRWIPPLVDFCLNVDGASKGNPGLCGGGGCIRDKHGTIPLAFANFYGVGSNIIAETRDLCDGLRMAHFLGVCLSAIYSDSSTLVQFMQQGKCSNWHIQCWWHPSRDLLQGNVTILSHVFRETNQVADRLANHATSSRCNEKMISLALPTTRLCKSMLDGIPNELYLKY
ncbi:hypothetical protein Taro_034414 [Colocasia esculenta]|uniref:RNase H type-1 domain-containing protein n=1 Tax=Colocasia esculenta TaxID=4460 RepID=A0A843WBV2_COLES|nr:hypothetical protein [Colocasia esculenta]